MNINKLPEVSMCIALQFHMALNKIERRRTSRVWPKPIGFVFLVEYMNKLVRCQMLESRGLEEILVYFIDEGCEVIIARQNKNVYLSQFLH